MAKGKTRSRAEWRDILAGLDASGLTQKQYAKQVGCHPSAFGWWRKRFKEREAETAAEPATSCAEPGFVELRPAESVGPVRLETRCGAVVTFAALPPAEYLVALLRQG